MKVERLEVIKGRVKSIEVDEGNFHYTINRTLTGILRMTNKGLTIATYDPKTETTRWFQEGEPRREAITIPKRGLTEQKEIELLTKVRTYHSGLFYLLTEEIPQSIEKAERTTQVLFEE